MVEVLAGVEKVCAAARAGAAGRVEESGAWRARGYGSGAQWLAKTLGTSRGQAGAAIETAQMIEGLAATREAFAAGRLSEAQAGEVAGRRRWTPQPKPSCWQRLSVTTGGA